LSLEVPSIISLENNCVPSSIERVLTRLHERLSRFDFNERASDVNWILRQIDTCQRILGNKISEEKARKRKLALQGKRKNKIKIREKRLLDYLEKNRHDLIS